MRSPLPPWAEPPCRARGWLCAPPLRLTALLHSRISCASRRGAGSRLGVKLEAYANHPSPHVPARGATSVGRSTSMQDSGLQHITHACPRVRRVCVSARPAGKSLRGPGSRERPAASPGGRARGRGPAGRARGRERRARGGRAAADAGGGRGARRRRCSSVSGAAAPARPSVSARPRARAPRRDPAGPQPAARPPAAAVGPREPAPRSLRGRQGGRGAGGLGREAGTPGLMGAERRGTPGRGPWGGEADPRAHGGRAQGDPGAHGGRAQGDPGEGRRGPPARPSCGRDHTDRCASGRPGGGCPLTAGDQGSGSRCRRCPRPGRA